MRDYQRALEAADRQLSGYDDLVVTLAEAGLGVPRIPAALRERLRRIGEWHWTTLDDDAQQPSPLEDSMMESAPFLRGPVPDHLTISHAGHGPNSYALTVRAAYGSAALVVQEGYGVL